MQDSIIYIVQKGDTLYSISQKHQISVSQLMELNQLKNTRIYPGQVLFLRMQNHSVEEIKNYQDFMKENQGFGTLKIQTLLGNSYLPISGVKIEVYKIFEKEKKIFFQGTTEESGLLDGISLPTQKRREDYLNGATIYQIQATHPHYETYTIYEVSIYDEIKSLQKIEMFPKGVE